MHPEPLQNIPLIPIIGLGTWKSAKGEVHAAVKEAISLGYRHIDCAPAYGNEEEVGMAISESMRGGAVAREDLWITSKLWNNAHEPEKVLPALQKTLSDLRLDFLDLFLIHWPVAFKAEVDYPRRQEDWFSLAEIPIIETWRAMEECVGKGLARHIGVCNFSVKKLEDLRGQAAIPPAMNQVELHPYLQQKAIQEYCRENGILLTAYSPLGSGDRPKGLKRDGEPVLLHDPVIKGIAEKHQVPPGQVILAWAMQRDIIVIPKSVNPERLRQNLAAAEVTLDAADIAAIAGLDRGYRYVDGSFWQNNGSPYTVADLWDE
jgi:alcohol dehydrogenase (NADP+)